MIRMLKGKELMTSFVLANVVDTASTFHALSLPGSSEVNPLFNMAFSGDHPEHAIIGKVAVTAIVSGMYALAHKRRRPWFKYIELSFQGANAYIWAMPTFNLAQAYLFSGT